MKERSEYKNNFIMQAGILAIAGIIVRIIGFLYRAPLTAVIGDEGNGYYSFAYNIYVNILLISSYSIPSAISKIMAPKLALKEYKNAQRIFRCALIYVTVVGIAGAAFAFFAARSLVVDNAVPVLRIFAPTIFLSGFLGVFRGYFQAHKSMIPTSISQILEQIINAGVSIGAALLFIKLLGDGADATQKAIRGASGSAFGTGSGVLIALLFVGGIYFLNRTRIRQKVESDYHKAPDSFAVIFKELLLVVTPFILSTFIYNCSTAVNQTIYAKVMMKVHELSMSQISVFYGIYSGKGVVLRNVPVALASAMSAAIIPTIAEAWTLNDKKGCRHKLDRAMKTTMIVAIPCVFGFVFLAKPIIMFLFPQKESIELASYVLMGLAITVVFYCMSTITNGVLQSIGQVNKPVIHAAIALGLQSMLLFVLLRFTGLNIYALVIVDIFYSLTMCILNGLALKKYMKYHQEYISSIIMPALCALVMGIVTFGIYHLFYKFTERNLLSLCISVAFAVVIYFVLIIVTRTVNEDEIKGFPKGATLLRLAKKVRLIR